jgi:hypothetical protein
MQVFLYLVKKPLEHLVTFLHLVDEVLLFRVALDEEGVAFRGRRALEDCFLVLRYIKYALQGGLLFFQYVDQDF